MDENLNKIKSYEKKWKPDMTVEEMIEIRKKNLKSPEQDDPERTD